MAPEDPTIPIPDRQLAGKAQAPSSTPIRRTADLRPRIVAGLFAVAVIAIAAGRLSDDDPPAVSAESAAPAASVASAPEPPAPAAPAPTSGAAPAAMPGPIRASLARRECMAQVEAGRLFIEQARQATDRGNYETQVTREIERLAAAGAISEHRLTLVSIRMWGLRDGDTPAAPWWTDQYRRCEATRLRDGAYVVGAARR